MIVGVFFLPRPIPCAPHPSPYPVCIRGQTVNQEVIDVKACVGEEEGLVERKNGRYGRSLRAVMGTAVTAVDSRAER